MTEPRRSLSLQELAERLAKARGQQQQAKNGDQQADRPASPLGWAFRVGVDLVAALIVGVGIGWLLDHAFGTMPLFLVLFFFLGAAAGALNVWRLIARSGMMSGAGDDRGHGDRD